MNKLYSLTIPKSPADFLLPFLILILKISSSNGLSLAPELIVTEQEHVSSLCSLILRGWILGEHLRTSELVNNPPWISTATQALNVKSKFENSVPLLYLLYMPLAEI